MDGCQDLGVRREKMKKIISVLFLIGIMTVLGISSVRAEELRDIPSNESGRDRKSVV